MYAQRHYRSWVSGRRLCRFRIVRFESDIEIAADTDLSIKACEALHRVRRDIENYILEHPSFAGSLIPMKAMPGAPAVVQSMAEASSMWNVGPMASVAGAVSQAVGHALSSQSRTLIVENGGDVFVRSDGDIHFSLFAGDSPFTGRIIFQITAPHGKGVCTSSGTVGHSLSFGRADAVTVIADECTVADAAATAIANRITGPEDLAAQLEDMEECLKIDGVIACCGDMLATLGVKLTEAPAWGGD